MYRRSLAIAALLGGLTSLPLIALAYLGQQLASLPFFPFDLFDWLARTLPGNIIAAGIDTMVRAILLVGTGPISSSAKRIEQASGIVLVIIIGAVLGAVVQAIASRSSWPAWRIGAIAGTLAAIALIAIGASLSAGNGGAGSFGSLWTWALVTAWGGLLGWALEKGAIARTVTPGAASPEADLDASGRISRRQMLVRLGGGSIAIALAGWGAGSLLARQRAASGAGQALSELITATPEAAASPAVLPGAGAGAATEAPPAAATPAALAGQLPIVPGTRPELTSTDQFYRIDIDTLPPTVKESTWSLEVRGLFDRARPLKLSDLAAFPPVTQTITQSCISNPVGGDLIGTVNYTGARLREVLMSLGLRAEARALNIGAADGFYESVEMADMMDARTLLVYGMNGETLPIEHGFPLRIFIPNRYGMKQPKWITSIEAVDRDGQGYWVDRGWSAEARPQIVSVIDTVAKDHADGGRVPVGGIAWAGDRGIAKVEVQVDNGPWQAASLVTPPLSPLTWVDWRYDWPATKGRHTLRVRATDGKGTAQVSTDADTFPDGATGYHSVTVTI